jgi:hypothetical protein
VDPQNAQRKELQEWWLKIRASIPDLRLLGVGHAVHLAMGMKKAQSADPVKIADAMHGAHWDGLCGAGSVGMKSVYGIDTTITRAIRRGDGRQADAAYSRDLASGCDHAADARLADRHQWPGNRADLHAYRWA